MDSAVCSVQEVADSIPGSDTFHKLSVTGDRVSTEYCLTPKVKPAQENLTIAY